MTGRRWLNDAVLGLRLVQFQGTANGLRALLFVVAVTTFTCLALASTAAPFVVATQQERAHDRHVVRADGGATAFSVIDDRLYQDRLWNGNRISRQYLSAPPNYDGPPPPGLSEFPRAGEVHMSPALRDLLRRDPVVAALFDEFEVVDTIEPAGLLGPDELRAVAGVRSNTEGLVGGAGFGAAPTGLNAESDARVNLVVTGVFLMACIVPAVTLVVLAARMSAVARRRRAASLRMVGASRARVARVLATEAFVLSVPAAVVGIGIHLLLRRSVDHVPLTRTSFYSADAGLPTWALLLVSALVVVLTSTLAARESGAALTSVRPAITEATIRRWPLVVLAIGVIGVIAWPLLAGTSTLGGLGFWVFVAILGVALASAAATLCRRLGSWAISRVRHGGSQLGHAIVRSQPGSTVYLSGMLAVTILVIGVSSPFTALLNGGDEDRAARVQARAAGVSLVIRNIGGRLSIDEVRRWSGVDQAVLAVQADTDRHDQITVVAARCPQVAEWSRSDLSGCDGDGGWLTADPGQALFAGQGHRLTGPVSVTLPPKSERIVVPGLSQDLQGALLLSPSRVSDLKVPSGQRGLVLLVNPSSASEVSARLASRIPVASTQSGEFGYSDPDRAQYPDQVAWIRLAALCSLFLAALAFIMATLADALRLRGRLRRLIVMGCPTRELLRAHAASTWVPMAVMTAVAAGSSWLAFQGLRTLDDRAAVSSGLYVLMPAACWAVGAIAVLVTAAPLAKPLSPDEVTEI